MQAQSPVPAEERGRATFEEAGDFGVGRDTPLRTLRPLLPDRGKPSQTRDDAPKRRCPSTKPPPQHDERHDRQLQQEDEPTHS